MASPSAVAVRLQFEKPPSIRSISTTRRFVEDLCSPIVGSDVAAVLAMVVHELMENLTKYADDAPVELALNLGHRDVCIATTNTAEQQQLAKLDELLTEIAKSSDPRATFQTFIGRSVEEDVGSRLGLARIRAEGGMELHWVVHGTAVTIRAEARLPMETSDGH